MFTPSQRDSNRRGRHSPFCKQKSRLRTLLTLPMLGGLFLCFKVAQCFIDFQHLKILTEIAVQETSHPSKTTAIHVN